MNIEPNEIFSIDGTDPLIFRWGWHILYFLEINNEYSEAKVFDYLMTIINDEEINNLKTKVNDIHSVLRYKDWNLASIDMNKMKILNIEPIESDEIIELAIPEAGVYLK